MKKRVTNYFTPLLFIMSWVMGWTTVTILAASAKADTREAVLLSEGLYQQHCSHDEDENYFEQFIEYRSGHLVWKFLAFEDSACQSLYLTFVREFKVNSLNINFQNQTASQVLNTTSVDSSYTSQTDEVTRALNSIHYCGFTNWVTEKSQSVQGRKCDDYQQLKKDESKNFNYTFDGSYLQLEGFDFIKKN